MADIRLAKPVAGTTQTVPSAPDGRFIFDFPADAATLTRNGDDLVLSFEDGSSIRLQGFYTTYSKEDMPSFQVEGGEQRAGFLRGPWRRPDARRRSCRRQQRLARRPL